MWRDGDTPQRKYEKFLNTMSQKQGVILISELGQEQFICSQSFLSYPMTRLANFPVSENLKSPCFSLGERKRLLSFSLCTTPTKYTSRNIIFSLLASTGEGLIINVFGSPFCSQTFPQQVWKRTKWSHLYQKSIRSFTAWNPWFHKMGQCWRKVSFLGIKIGNLLSGISPASHIITSMTN